MTRHAPRADRSSADQTILRAPSVLDAVLDAERRDAIRADAALFSGSAQPEIRAPLPFSPAGFRAAAPAVIEPARGPRRREDPMARRAPATMIADFETPARRAVSAFGLFCAAAAALVLSFVTPVKAAGAERAFASDLIETGSVYAPRGFTELCERRPEFCAAEKAAAETDPVAETLAAMFGAEAAGFQPPVLTQARLETLARVNTAVNAAIRPVPDAGADRWELNAAQGDCEDYVLMKREMLARLGWPRSALRITVVRDAQGYHAVLVAETDQGGFVLDNMTQNLTRVSQNPYEFVVSQSIDTPGAWVRVHKR